MRKYIIDETPFVYVSDRGVNDAVDRLNGFIVASRKRKINGKYSLYSTYVSRKRLGHYPYYFWIKCFARTKFFRPDARVCSTLEKRARRIKIAKNVIVKYFKRSPIDFFRRSELLDLYLHANEEKSRSLGGKKMVPSDVIPLETCIVAQIAHRKNLTILSFNTDYRYFVNYWKYKNDYISYREMDDFLLNDFPSH